MRVSETYLYKVHTLKRSLDKAFDRTLRRHADMTLSQFMLLLAVMEHRTINQRTAAGFLHVSPAAVNRQTEIAMSKKWLYVKEDAEGRGLALALSPAGNRAIQKGIGALEQYAFKVFADENRQTNLMTHIDLLLSNTKGVIIEQAMLSRNDNKGANHE